MKLAARLAEIALLLAISAAIFLPLVDMPQHPAAIRDYCVERGIPETGAPNLVSAIYLGWRAYDTLGETIVLLLAVTGALFLLGGKE